MAMTDEIAGWTRNCSTGGGGGGVGSGRRPTAARQACTIPEMLVISGASALGVKGVETGSRCVWITCSTSSSSAVSASRSTSAILRPAVGAASAGKTAGAAGAVGTGAGGISSSGSLSGSLTSPPE